MIIGSSRGEPAPRGPASVPPLVAAPAGDVRVASGRLAERALTPADRQLLDDVTTAHLRYFLANRDPKTGLVKDSSAPSAHASTAATGFGLTAYGVAVHRGLMPREEAAAATLKALKALAEAPQARKNGFFYHFLKADTVTRGGKSEISTVDTALLLGGALFARNFFDADTPEEREIRAIATRLYRDVDWNWARNGGSTLSMGWTPEPQPFPFGLWNRLLGRDPGFIPFRWSGYSEGSLMVLLGMGSPTHPLPDDAWKAYHRADRREGNHVAFGPLFGHQYSHAWIDFRGIEDAASRKRGFDWHENSRRAVHAQHAYAVDNPRGFEGYGQVDWGITASLGPGRITREIAGRVRRFMGYFAREAGKKDDGTIAPTAAAASLPFAPELVLPTLHHWRKDRPELWTDQGFQDAYNDTAGWVAKERLGIDQGPIVLMTENFRSGFVWEVMKKDPDLRRGLQRAGFEGGWLG